MKNLNIPVGISDFEKIRNDKFYYVDKTGLVAELLKTKAEVTLITRPRRFGKTLGMSMLESFFDIRKDSKSLFKGLEITQNQNLCHALYTTIFQMTISKCQKWERTLCIKIKQGTAATIFADRG